MCLTHIRVSLLVCAIFCSSPISLNSISMCLRMHCFRLWCWAAFPFKSLLIKRLMSFKPRKYPELFISNFLPSFCSVLCSGNSLFQMLDNLDLSSNSIVIPLMFVSLPWCSIFLAIFLFYLSILQVSFSTANIFLISKYSVCVSYFIASCLVIIAPHSRERKISCPFL